MLTFEDVKNDRGIKTIAGVCPSSSDFADLVNSAVRRAMRRGDFVGTLQPIYLCMRAGCVVWPRYVGQVRKLGWCRVPITPVNMWGSFLPTAANAPWRAGCHWMMPANAMVDQGHTSVFQDVMGEGRLIRAYARCNQDYGKTVTIFGIDNDGQPLQHQNATTKDWEMGQILTLQQTYASTSSFVRRIDYILKDETQCPINLYAYNATTLLLEEIGQYDPGETRPSFSKSKITMPWVNCGGTCGTSRGISALVKLRFIPVKYDTDLVLIDNLEALKYLIQSCKFGEAGDRNNAKAFEADAIQELNRQLEDEFPDDQMPNENHVFAGANFTNQCF